MKFSISRFKIFLVKNGLLLKIILSYIIIGALLLSFLSFVLFQKFSSNRIEDINELSDKMLLQADQLTDQLMTYTFSYFFDLFQNDPDIFTALYGITLDQNEKMNAYKKLTRPIVTNSLIHSVSVFNPKADLVLSSNYAPSSVEDFREKDDEIVSILKGSSFPNGYSIIPRKIKSIYLNPNPDLNILTLIFTEGSGEDGGRSALFVNLNQTVLYKMLAKTNDHQIYTLFMIDKTGSIISNDDTKTLSNYANAKDFIKQIVLSDHPSDHFIENEDKSKYVVTYRKSPNWGWTFVSIGEYEKLNWKLNAIKLYVILTTVIFILLAIAVGIYFTTNIYNPLYKLLKKIRSSQSNHSSRDIIGPFDLLDGTYNKMMENITELQFVIPAKKNELLRKIIVGDFLNESQIFEEVRKANISFKKQHYTVCLFTFDSFHQWSKTKKRSDWALLRFALSNIAYEIFNDIYPIEVVESREEHLCLIVNTDDNEAALIEKLTDSILSTQHIFSKYYKITLTGSIGTIVDNLSDISQSYHRAIEVAQYRMIYGKESILTHSALEKQSFPPFEYPNAVEQRLLNQLKLGNYTLVNKEVNEFMNALSCLAYEDILLSLTKLAVDSMQTIKCMIDFEKHGLHYNSILEQVNKLETLKEIREWLLSFYTQVMEYAKNKQVDRRDHYIKIIVDYIQQNYFDSNLSLQSISDHVGLSANYTRVTFKELTHSSLSDFINEVRFNKAAELLKTTDFTAAKISETVGFSNVKYFYIAFKKHMGNSPDHYRKDL